MGTTSNSREVLAPGEVHVWLAGPSTPIGRALIRRRRTLLGSEEVARCESFQAPQLRLRHILGQALVRVALSRYRAVAPHAWRFTVAPGGRPVLVAPGPAEFCFSISSTPGLVACAIARLPGLGIGIDVEAAAPAPDLDLAERLLSPRERRGFRRLPPGRQKHRFYDLWTLKEACLKACGVGLAMPPQSIGFHLGKRITVAHAPAAPTGNVWKFELLRPTRVHHAAVAAYLRRGTKLRIQMRWWGT